MTEHYAEIAAAIESGSTDAVLEAAWEWAEHECPPPEPSPLSEPLTTAEGVTFTPYRESDALGWKVTAPDGRVEYVLLAPSVQHEFNPANGAIADTFLYVVDQPDADRSPMVEAVAVTYVNHFNGPPTAT